MANQHSASVSTENLVPARTPITLKQDANHIIKHGYSMERYVLRTLLNTAGPLLFTALYVFIVVVYLRRPVSTDNIVTQLLPISARLVFYGWILLSIFALDCAKAGLAGFEATCLMAQAISPSNAMELMWHADRSWGGPSGWWKASVILHHELFPKGRRHIEQRLSKAPGKLWWYLATSSFLFFVAVPLTGLSMDPLDAWKVGNHKVSIPGTNQATFNMQYLNLVAESAKSRWAQGNPTTPHGATVFYAPEGTFNVSNTFYDDTIKNLTKANSTAHSVSFFSGPQVSERVNGRAWGLLTTLSCTVVNPYRDLTLLQVREMDDWTAPGLNSSQLYGTDPSWNQSGGLISSFFDQGWSFGVNYKYLIASVTDLDGHHNSDLGRGAGYTNDSQAPGNGRLELVMWQTYDINRTPDVEFQSMASNPFVVRSSWRLPYHKPSNTTFLGYAVACHVNSTVGDAKLDAISRTYTKFSPSFADSAPIIPGGTRYRGIMAIQSLVYGAFTTVSFLTTAPPTCDGYSGTKNPSSLTCNPWLSANVATRGTPSIDSSNNMQYPILTPERMNLALYKLFGEVAIRVMASGPEPWRGELNGLEPTNHIQKGVVPWQFALSFLLLWTIVTVLPNLWVLRERRWAETLGGFEWFRFGAAWTDKVDEFEGNGFLECTVLQRIPGMVGDMEPGKKNGFIGLSRTSAKCQGRIYVHKREP